MPRGDGTGPMGMGSMTGRAAGYCTGNSVPGYANPVMGGGMGFGRGRGMRFGAQAGFGRARMGNYLQAPFVNSDGDQKMEILRNQAKSLQDALQSIQGRISELESKSKAKK